MKRFISLFIKFLYLAFWALLSAYCIDVILGADSNMSRLLGVVGFFAGAYFIARFTYQVDKKQGRIKRTMWVFEFPFKPNN